MVHNDKKNNNNKRNKHTKEKIFFLNFYHSLTTWKLKFTEKKKKTVLSSGNFNLRIEKYILI